MPLTVSSTICDRRGAPERRISLAYRKADTRQHRADLAGVMSYREPAPMSLPVTLSVAPISDAEHLAFVRAQRSVNFVQTAGVGAGEDGVAQ